ncbi:hypothetical protein M9Y10_040684 [Tritrichomonas musculus]|uniref:Mediator complex subunit 14 n=1 Tax=Tritrichomonas musculus TaxID=1915356 RepID=A0ABR2K294_9EUKA
MNGPDLLFSKRENGKILIQEVFHAALRKCEKQLLLINNIESPFIQKRTLISSMYSSKLLLGRFLSLYRCYRRSKSHISTDVSKIDIENILQQTNTSMYNIYRTLKKGFSSSDSKMSRNFKFIDFQEPRYYESQFVTLLRQEFPSNIENVEIHGKKWIFFNKNNYYNFTISFSGSKKLYLSDLFIKWPNINSMVQEKIFKNLIAQCQIILNNSDNFLVELNGCIQSTYFYGELLRICQIIRKKESVFGYQTLANNGTILVYYPNTFSPGNVFKLVSVDARGVFLQSCSPICSSLSDCDESDAKFLLYNMDGLDEAKVLNILTEIHNLIHFSKIKSILKRFRNFFSSSNIAFLKLTDSMQAIECSIFKVLVFKIGIDFITGDPIVFFNLFPNMNSLLIKSMICHESNCNQHLRAFCAFFFLQRFLNYPLGVHLNAISDAGSLSIPSGKFATFTFSKYCNIAYDDTGLIPILRSFADGQDLQSEKILYFNSISPRNLDIKSLDAFFPSVFYDLINKVIMRDLINELQRSGIDVKYIEKKILFSMEPFGLIKFKIKSSYWKLHFMYSEVSNAPDDFGIKIIGRFISCRFVHWLLFFIKKVTTFMQALKQVKTSLGTSNVVRKVVPYNSLYFKIEFNSITCLPISFKIIGIDLDHTDKTNCEVYKISNPWANLQINCSAYQSLLLKGYINSLLQTSEASYRFGPFLAGFMLPFQKVQQVFLSEPDTQWIATSVQEGFSFFLIYKRTCTLLTIIRSSQTLQIILPNFSNSAILQFAIPFTKFERCKPKINSAIHVNISQLELFKESIEEFFAERETIESLQFQQPDYITKMPCPQIVYNGPPYCPTVRCVLDENGIHISSSDSSPKYLKNILNIPIEGRKYKRQFIKFVFSTLKLFQKGNDFLKTLNDINEMRGHPLNWQQSVENDGLNVNMRDKSISMILTTNVGRFFLVVYPDSDSNTITLSSDQGFQIEKVSTMNNLKSWFKKIVSDDSSLPADDNDDPSFFL